MGAVKIGQWAEIGTVATLVAAIARHLHAHDPDHASLKSAARTAIFMPATFAFADNVIGNPQTTIFSAFGSFSILVLADFEGSSDFVDLDLTSPSDVCESTTPAFTVSP